MKDNLAETYLDQHDNRYRLRSTRPGINNEPEVRVYSWKSSQNIFNVENDMLKSLPKFS